MRKAIPVIATALALLVGYALCGQKAPLRALGTDGFPTGHSTAEGAACDLARAYIERSPASFRGTCIRPYGPSAYEDCLDNFVASMKQEAANEVSSTAGPREIGKVFAARHLAMDGPASSGYALFGFQDVMFVDVGVVLHSGDRFLNRTLVIRDKDGLWYVHPSPEVSPLLAAGLDDEAPSLRDFSDVSDGRR